MKTILRVPFIAVGKAWLLLGVASAFTLVSVTPREGTAQAAHWSARVAPQVTRFLGKGGGPTLGAVGGSVEVLRGSDASGWVWGGAATLHRLGTFTGPLVPDRNNRTLAVGVRALRSALDHGWFLNLGADLASVEEKVGGPGDVGWSRDPGVGVYLGAGWSERRGGKRSGFFVESGVTAVLASGESTVGGGAYFSMRAGFAF